MATAVHDVFRVVCRSLADYSFVYDGKMIWRIVLVVFASPPDAIPVIDVDAPDRVRSILAAVVLSAHVTADVLRSIAGRHSTVVKIHFTHVS